MSQLIFIDGEPVSTNVKDKNLERIVRSLSLPNADPLTKLSQRKKLVNKYALLIAEVVFSFSEKDIERDPKLRAALVDLCS